jgi:hypothetical protein
LANLSLGKSTLKPNGLKIGWYGDKKNIALLGTESWSFTLKPVAVPTELSQLSHNFGSHVQIVLYFLWQLKFSWLPLFISSYSVYSIVSTNKNTINIVM